MSTTKLPEIIVSGTAVSDLFFNIEKHHTEELYDSKDEPTDAETDAALLLDARDFCAMIGAAADTLTPETLVANYVERL